MTCCEGLKKPGAADVDVVAAVGFVGDVAGVDRAAREVYRDHERQPVECPVGAIRRLAPPDDPLIVRHSRYKDRGLVRGPVDIQTCMRSATATCSRSPLGAILLLAESLLRCLICCRQRFVVAESLEKKIGILRLCAFRTIYIKQSYRVMSENGI